MNINLLTALVCVYCMAAAQILREVIPARFYKRLHNCVQLSFDCNLGQMAYKLLLCEAKVYCEANSAARSCGRILEFLEACCGVCILFNIIVSLHLKHTLNQRQKRSAAVQAVSNSKGKRKQKLNKKATTSTEKNKKNAKVDKMDRSKTSRDSASNKIKKQHRPSKFNFVENKCKRKHHSGRSNYRKHRDEHNTNNGYDKQPHCILKAVPEMNSTSSNYNTSSKQIRKQKKSKQLHPKSNWSATKTEDKKRKINKLVDSPAGVQSSQSDKPTIKVTTTLPGGKAVKHAPRSSKLFAYSNDKQNTKTPNNFNRRLWIRWQNNKIFKLASKCWRYLVSDSSSDDSQTDYMHLSGFAMAIDVKSAGNSFSKHAVKKDPRREEMISTPSGVYMKNGKLCVGFRYRYRLSNFLKSTEGKLWVLRSNYAVPESILNEINGNDEMIYDRNARVVVSKPSVGYEHRYRISNYLKTLNVDEISNLYDQGYLRPIIMPGNAPGIVNQQTIKSSTLVFTNIWRAIANLFTYQHCVEYETYNGSDISIDTSKTEKKKNSLTGTIGYAFRYRLSRKLDAEKKLAGLEESSDRVKLKPPNVLYPYRYRVSNMLRSFNITYEDMAKMMKNNTWDGFRRKKETIKQKHDRQISVLSETDQLIGLSEEERLLKEAKLVGNPELSKIHIDIKDLYPAELISVGYTYRYRRSRKMIALNISKYEIEKRRWFLLEQKFKDNTLKLLSKTEHLKHSNESTKEEKYAAELMNTAKTVGVIFTLDYSQLTPEEKRVGYEYRYRISRKYQTQMPLYILKNLNNSTNLSMKVFQKLKAKDELKIDEGEDYFKQNLNYHSPHHLDYMQLSDKVNDILNSNKANTYSIIRKYMQRNDGISLTKQETENKEIGEKCRVKRAKGNSKRHGSATNNKSRKKLEPYVADSVKVTCDVDDIKKENHIDSFEDYSNKITVKEPKQLKDKSSHPKKRKSTLRDIKQSDQVSNRPQLDTKYKDSSYTQQNQENKPLRPIASTNDQLGKIDNMEQTFRSDDVSDHVDVTESTKDNTVKDKIHKLTNQNDKSLSTDHDVKQDATANHNPDNHEYVIDTKTVSFVELTHIWWKRLLTEIFNLII
ncbi:hypothetical protein GJ496_008902 [Pomphorhynchus laevis]|nr:hypothetical protein GJ496_008902 [Pomphorhynchus laevis]